MSRTPAEPSKVGGSSLRAGALPSWVGPALLAALFLALTVWSWRKWPDVLVDFGWQAYVAWRVAEGETLYRDHASLYGPLSVYLNAGLFRVFGLSLTTLFVANLALLATVTGLVHSLVARSTDRLTAFVACAVLLGVFAFSQYTGTGNYNFVAPYAHEATHGFALGVALLAGLDAAARRGARWGTTLAGLSLGLVALTKPEAASAALAAAVVGLGLMAGSRAQRRFSAPELARFLGAALLPLAAFFTYFLSRMPAAEAWRGTLGAWVPLVDARTSDNPFHAAGMGFDQPAANLARMLVATLVVALWVAGALVIDGALRRAGRRSGLAAALLASAVGALLLRFHARIPWSEAARPLPLLVLMLLTLAVVAVRRSRARQAPDADGILLATSATFAAVLLAKMALNPRIHHYGFTLALPATLLVVVAVVGLVPRALARRGGGAAFRALALAAVVAGVVQHLQWSNEAYRRKDLPVGSGGDAFLAFGEEIEARGAAAAEALRALQDTVPAEATLAVLPEGAMLNYLARRRSSIPFANFMVPEVRHFGETSMLTALTAHPPDFVLLVHKDTREFGPRFFGADPAFGQATLAWVRQDYRLVQRIRAEPLRRDEFGIQLMEHAVLHEPGAEPRPASDAER